MKKTVIMTKAILTFALLGFGGTATLAAEAQEVRRFGLFIGANNGGDERQRLLYADDDARAMNQTMEDIGGIDPEDSILLIDPSSTDIRNAMDILRNRINSVGNVARRTEIMFYYSGHSDEQGLMLSDEKLPYKSVRADLDASGADVVIAVLDSCSSGAFTRSKGGQRRSPFLIDESSSMEGHAFLTSSSETELSQESDRIEGSFFTYYLLTGLRGAADNTGDGRVSLNEVYEHTFRETLSSTESTIGGPQHPAYEIQLTGTGDLVLTDLTIPTSALMISGELAGRFSIRSDRDKLVAEFSKYEEDTFKMALPAGEYRVNWADGDRVLTADVELSRNGQFFLTERDFQAKRLAWTRFRGGSQENGELEIPFSVSLFPGVNFPAVPDNSVVTIQAGFSAYAPRFEGIQANYLFNITEDDSVGLQYSNVFNIASSNFRGLQTTGVFNIAGENLEGIQGAGVFNIAGGVLHGVQGSGVFNIAGDEMQGIQGAGVFNICGRPSSGVQGAGIFNIAGEFEGVQAAGIFNASDYLNGMQLSLVNWAGTMNGLQVGLVNVSREMDGLALGLVNLSRNGIVEMGAWYEYDGSGKFYPYFQSGSRYFYTLYFVGNKFPDHSLDDFVYGAHAGFRLGLGPFNLDIEGGVRQDLGDRGDQEWTSTVVPSGRAVIALKGLGLYWGVSAVLEYPDGPSSVLYDGSYNELFGEKGLNLYPDFIAGIRLKI
ncbi:MAG: caspase family protein [Spirochaetales bacterium]|nr:caspase family protein [Spirochaetales bacterium]